MTQTLHSSPPHCLVAISSHGFGHLAQVAPVINTAHTLSHFYGLQNLKWTVRSLLEPDMLRERVRPPLHIDAGTDDFGMVMHDALAVDLVASLKRYKLLHSHWDARVQAMAQHLVDLQVDTLLADIPYLSLAGAARAGIPAIALCSLNWAAILQDCVSRNPRTLSRADLSTNEFDGILRDMHQAYESATVFLTPEPSMPMTGLTNLHSIGPVCERQLAPDNLALQRAAARQGHSQAGWFVLVSLGGIATDLSMTGWPTHCLGRPIYYLVAPHWTHLHPHAISTQSIHLGFSRLLSHCDLVITKPGYGTFVQAACAAKPVIYLERPQWSEAQALVKFIHAHGRASVFNPRTLETTMATLLKAEPASPVIPSGNASAAHRLLETLAAAHTSKA